MNETTPQSDAPAEPIARAFHDAYERLAPEFGYATREASAKPWEDVPEANRRLMIATVRELLDQGVIRPESWANDVAAAVASELQRHGVIFRDHQGEGLEPREYAEAFRAVVISERQEALNRADAAQESLQRELSVAEDRARNERKEADKLRRELALARTKIARLEREKDPDYDPRDGDPSLQKGVGAIPLGRHELIDEAEHIEGILGMAPTFDQQLRSAGMTPPDADRGLGQGTPVAMLQAKGPGVTLDDEEGLRVCSWLVGVYLGPIRTAVDRLVAKGRYDGLGDADLNYGRELLWFGQVVRGADFYRFDPVQQRARRAREIAREDGPRDTEHLLASLVVAASLPGGKD